MILSPTPMHVEPEEEAHEFVMIEYPVIRHYEDDYEAEMVWKRMTANSGIMLEKIA